MTEVGDARVEHPDELLAGYVDGSASPRERRAVEAHLAGCPKCREDLQLATHGRAAILSLPELDAPGLAAGGLEAFRTAGDSVEDRAAPAAAPAGIEAPPRDDVTTRREARREAPREGRREAGVRRRWQASWVAVAGAAAVLALFAIVPVLLRNSNGKSPSAAGGIPAASPQEAGNYAPVFASDMNYDQSSIRALAVRLAQDEQSRSGSPLKTPRSARAPADVAAPTVVRCAIEGTGLPSATAPIYLEKAKFQGTPVYLVGIVAPGGARSHVQVYVISQQDCALLYEADQPF